MKIMTKYINVIVNKKFFALPAFSLKVLYIALTEAALHRCS